MEMTTGKEFAPLAGEATKLEKLNEINAKHKGNARIDQRSRLLLAVREFSVSTLEARKYLDIMHPAGRVMELRACGWQIDTIWVTQESESGKPHRVASYLYRGSRDA